MHFAFLRAQIYGGSTGWCAYTLLGYLHKHCLNYSRGLWETLWLVEELEKLYLDLHPKWLCLPKDTVVKNFHTTLWEWPSRWHEHLTIPLLGFNIVRVEVYSLNKV